MLTTRSFLFPRCRFPRVLALLGLTASLFLLGGVAHADRFALEDGTIFEAAFIGEVDGVITILDAEGERTIRRADLEAIQQQPVRDPSLRLAASKARARFRKRCDREVRTILKEYRRAKEAERSSIAARLDGYRELDQVAALADAVMSKKKAVRQLAIERLEKMSIHESVIPLVLVSVISKDDTESRRVRDVAIDRNRDLSRHLYEYAAELPMEAHARIHALDSLGEIGNLGSTPSLIATLYSLGIEAGLERAEVRGFREKPLTLGNTRLTIQLPVVEHLRVATTARYRETVLEMLQKRTVRTLQTVTGRTLGNDVGAWQRWWKTEGKSKLGAGSKPPPRETLGTGAGAGIPAP